MSARADRTALVLTGGGAAAAYQAGVLKAVRQLLAEPRRNPFPILCGSSTGAINAAVVASRAEDFGAGVDFLLEMWQSLRAGDVYRADPAGLLWSGGRWLALLAFGRLFGSGPRSFLDNGPLARLLAASVDFEGIERAINHHALHAVSIAASGYGSGQSVAFFQGRADLEPWQHGQRVGAHVKLRLEHLLASTAIPFVFPAVKLHREWFGDGALRQLTPLSPALHFGADRILAIGAGPMAIVDADRESAAAYPTLAQVAGHTLAGIYMDSLSVDLERCARINRTLAALPAELRESQGDGLRPVQVLTLLPSQRLDHLAAEHEGALPWAIRWLLSSVGGRGRPGGAFASYLLFERPYIEALIELGYRDTMARRDEVAAFLGR